MLGYGPGSTFTDRYYPFPFGLTEGEYPMAEQETRQFSNSHSLITQLMLHVGYLGILIYLLCFALIYAELYAAYRRMEAPRLKLIALALLCFLPGMVYMSWNSKANMLLGIIVGGGGVLIAGGLKTARSMEPEGQPDASN